MRRHVAKIGTDPRSRFWYLPVPDEVRASLVQAGRVMAEEAQGAPDDADHITLNFVPKADAPLDDDEVQDALGAVARALEGFHPLEVWVGGVAYFDTASKDGEPKTALVALIDGPGLSDLHSVVARALRDHGWDWEDTHTYTAHVTLAYLPQGARAQNLPVIDEAWTVDEVRFANAEIHRLPLGGRVHEGALSREQLGIAVGEASMCWESPELAGVFRSDRASDIVERLYAQQFETGLVTQAIYTGFHGQVWEADRRDETGQITTYAFDVPTLQAWAEKNAPVTYVDIDRLNLDPEQSDPHDWDARLDMADLIYPILVVAVDGELAIMDGVHRAFKAERAGKTKMRARVLDWDELFQTGAERDPYADGEGYDEEEEATMGTPDSNNDGIAGIFDAPDSLISPRQARRLPMRRTADLTGEDMRRFRTEPDTGNGRLYTYCSGCTYVARTPVSGIIGCTKGDDHDVIDYSQRLDRGEADEQTERCPGFATKEADEGDQGPIARQARKGVRRQADLGSANAGMIKDVPGEAAPPSEDLQFDEDLQPVDLSDLDDLYRYMEAVGVDPRSPSSVGYPAASRAVSSWRGGLLAGALAQDPDLAHRVWDGFVERSQPAPPPAPVAVDDEGIEVADVGETPDDELEIDPEHYIWRTRHDRRVRPEHAAREGHVFSWDNPPWDGHPGTQNGCRCSAEALVDLPGVRVSGRLRICRRCGLIRR